MSFGANSRLGTWIRSGPRGRWYGTRLYASRYGRAGTAGWSCLFNAKADPAASGQSPLSQFVHRDCQDDHRADQRLLQIWRYAEQIAAIRKQPHDERADQRPDYAAF